jgi:agmatinase
MKIIGVPRINALGKVGPEEMSEAIKKELLIDFEILEIDNFDLEESEKIIFNKSRKIFNTENKICFVGGDHSITYPIFKAFKEKYDDAFLIVFDAHADCMTPMKEPTHEEFLRAIIEDGLNPKNVILVGPRKIEPEEEKFLIENGVKVFSEINDVEAATDYITEKALSHDVYLSIDIDVMDPAFAPAVNYPEPDGLNSREFFYMIKRILKMKSLRAIDIVEAIPSKDKNFDMRTMKNCAKIVEEFVNHLKS